MAAYGGDILSKKEKPDHIAHHDVIKQHDEQLGRKENGEVINGYEHPIDH